LEQFNLDLVTRTSDVITTERALRNLLGLPPADNRRIIPVTPPIEARLEPDWDTCLHEMLQEQPDVVEKKLVMGPPDPKAEKPCRCASHAGDSAQTPKNETREQRNTRLENELQQ